jgi:hypothetical protein
MIEMFFETYGEGKFCLQAEVPMAEEICKDESGCCRYMRDTY